MFVQIDFNIVKRDEGVLSNDICYHIRHAIAETFRDANFGDIIQGLNDRVENTHAHPFVDAFIGGERRELFIGYMIDIPTTQGDVSHLLAHALPALHQRISNLYPEVAKFIKVHYSGGGDEFLN